MLKRTWLSNRPADNFNRFTDNFLFLLKFIRMSLGGILLKHRRKHHYSQQQAAELLQVSQSTYCDWESDTAFPKAENLLKIAELYDIDINELLNPNVNIVNSPNTISSSPNSKIETSQALLKVAESIEKLIFMFGVGKPIFCLSFFYLFS